MGQTEMLAASLWRNDDGHAGELCWVPVLTRCDPANLARAIVLNSGSRLWQIGQVFKERYDSSTDDLDSELDWLPGLVEALRAEARDLGSTNPVRAWQVEEMIRWVFEPAVHRRD